VERYGAVLLLSVVPAQNFALQNATVMAEIVRDAPDWRRGTNDLASAVASRLNLLSQAFDL
jgi:hypothetical protein